MSTWIARRALPLVLFFVACLLAAGIFHNQLLWQMGAWLVNAEPPQQTDIVVVIGGDFAGDRITKGAELVRAGFAPRVLVSGSGAIYGRHEAELSIDLAVRHGFPREDFTPFLFPALSTADEAQAVVAELRHRGIHRFTVVTTSFHTARAGRIFRRAAPGFEVHVVEAPNKYWDHGHWWKHREGRKLWFFEAVKTLADYFRV